MRNYIAVISTVNCSATAVKKVVRHFDDPAIMGGYSNVDGACRCRGAPLQA